MKQPTAASSPYSVDALAAALWPAIDDLLPESVVGDIAAHAGAADEQGLLSEAILDRLRDAGYFGLPVPAAFEGRGAGLLECAAVQRSLARADPALAIALNMHLFSIGMAVEHWLLYQDTCGLLLEAIATQNRIVSSAFAEPGLGGSILHSNSKATRVDGGYVVSGVKTPCSLAGQCDLISLQMEAVPAEPDGLLLAVIPAATDGVRVERSWDSLGMRASASDTLVLEDVFVPDELVFHRCEPGYDDDEVFAAGLVWFCVTTTATYIGVAEAALGAAREELHRLQLSYLGESRADLPSVQSQLGEVVAGSLTLESACVGAARLLDSRAHDPRALVPLAVAIKHASVEVCIRAVEISAELLGGLAYARGGTPARLWRDVQAARFHPPTRLASREILGRWALGLPFSFQLEDRARPPRMTV
jgi:alkylation response protein AidB-like acyl-CoA dehydrogenase